MHIYSSPLGDDVRELGDIGYPSDYYGYGAENYIEATYKDLMKRLPKTCKLLIASLTTSQRGGIALLKKHGFKVYQKSKTNPNTGNKILLFVKTIRKRKKK
jgi:hypothetical protein